MSGAQEKPAYNLCYYMYQKEKKKKVVFPWSFIGMFSSVLWTNVDLVKFKPPECVFVHSVVVFPSPSPTIPMYNHTVYLNNFSSINWLKITWRVFICLSLYFVLLVELIIIRLCLCNTPCSSAEADYSTKDINSEAKRSKSVGGNTSIEGKCLHSGEIPPLSAVIL